MASSSVPDENGAGDQTGRKPLCAQHLDGGSKEFELQWVSPMELHLVGQYNINCSLSLHPESNNLTPCFEVVDHSGRRFSLKEVQCHVCWKWKPVIALTKPSAKRATRRANRALQSEANTILCGCGLIVCEQCFKQNCKTAKEQLVQKAWDGELVATIEMKVTIKTVCGSTPPKVERNIQCDMKDYIEREFEEDLFGQALADWTKVSAPPPWAPDLSA